MSDMKVQGEFEMDTTQGDQAFARVEAGARRMGQSVQQAGEQAGRGVEAIGRGAEKAAKDTERANSSMLSIIRRGQMETQRAIVESSGYTKGSAEGLEELARLRGGDVTAIQGQLVALRQLKSEHETLLASQRESASATLFDQQHQAAKRLVQDADYVRLWTTELAKKEAAEREAAASQLFEREHQAARKLAQDSEYVRMWTAALDQKEAAERKAASQDSFIASLKSQSDAIGKTRADLLELQAAQMGMSAQASPFIAKLREAEGGLGKLGASAGQTKAALAQLPMQFSDIVVSLQGGQAPLTVFLQQGAQIKDSFGGAGAAVKAVGGYALGLVNPFTAVAAAVAVLALGYYKGTQEADNYTRSLLLTGNAAGTTASQMQDMARRVGDVAGTQANAASVLAELAGTGKVAGANLERFTLTAVNMERNVGVAVKETVKDFAELGAAPVEASKKLNEQYGYLTTSIYEQIKALDKEGDALGAATLAQEAYDAGMAKVSAGMEQRLGYLQRGWNAVGEAAGWAWDKMLNVGRPDSMSDKLSAAQKNLEAAQRRGPLNDRPEVQASWQKGIDRLRAEIALLSEQERAQRAAAEAEAARTQAEKDGIAAVEAVTRANERGLTAQQRVNKELAAYRKGLEEIRATNPASALLDSKTIAQTEAWIRQNGQKGQKGQNSGQSELASIRAKVKAEEEYIQRLREHGAAADKLTEGEKLATKIQEELDGKLSAKARTLKELELVEAKRLATANKTRIAEEEQIKLDQKHAADYDKQIEAIYASAESTRQNAATQEAANASFGKSKTAIEEMTLATQKNRLANLESLGLTGEHTDALKVQIAEQERYVKSLRGADYKAQSAHTDELLRAAKEQAALYEDEARLVGLSALERSKVVALRQIELKYAKELAQVDLMADGTAEQRAAKEAQRLKVLEAKQVESSAVVAKVVEEDWAKTSQRIGDTLADYIMGGGKDAAQYLKRLFATLVLQPVVNYGVQRAMNAAGLGGGGSTNLMGLAQNASSLYNTGSTVAGWLGFGGSAAASGLGLTAAAGAGTTLAATGAGLGMTGGLGAGYGLAAGGGLGLTAGSAGAGAIGAGIGTSAAATGAGAAAGAGSAMSGVLAAAPYLAAAVALYAIIKGMDDSGTPHSGAGAVYSKSTGVQDGAGIYNQDTFGMGHRDEYSAAMQDGISGIAQGLGQTLDAFAVSFGKTAGYSVATAFADDSSKDGSWGSLKILDELGNKLVDWSDNRASKWAPREFGDGKEGYEEYLKAVAVDVKSAFAAMDLPAWADQILNTATDIDTLNTALQQIATVKTVLDGLGKTMAMFAGITDDAQTRLLATSGGVDALAGNAEAFYQGFYNEGARALKQRELQMAALAGMGLYIDPAEGDAAKELFRKTVQEAMGSGQVELAAQLLAMSGAFASTADYAQQMLDAVKDTPDAWAELGNAMVMFSGATSEMQARLLAAAGSMDALASGAGTFNQGFYREHERALGQRDVQMQSLADMGLYIDPAEGEKAKELFRKTVEEAMSSGQAELAVKLLAMAGEFASAADYAKQFFDDLAQSAVQSMSGAWSNFGTMAGLAAQYTGNTSGLSQQLGVVQGSYANATTTDGRVAALQQIINLEQGLWNGQQAARQAEAAAATARANAAREQVNAAKQLLTAAQGLGSYAKSLGFSEASGLGEAERLAALDGQRRDLLAKARAGDTGAMQDLQGVTGNYLTLAQQMAVSQQDYSVLSGRIAAELAATAAIQEASATSQVSQLERQIAAAESVASSSAEQFKVSAATQKLIDDLLVESATAFETEATLTQKLIDQGVMTTTALQSLPAELAGAIGASLIPAIAGLASAMSSAAGISVPQFADGGFHAGGLRIVGERGPELEATGPSRVWNQSQLARALGGGGNNDALLTELRALREDNRVQAGEIVRLNAKVAKVLERWDGAGMPDKREEAPV